MSGVSKKTVKLWLENYHALQAGEPIGENPFGGPKPEDGVTSSHLNKIMVDQAIQAMPPKLYQATNCRFIREMLVVDAIKEMNCGRGTYYRRNRDSINFVHAYVNGYEFELEELYQKYN